MRLVPFRPADLDAEQRALYDTIVGGPRASGRQAFPLTDGAGRLTGPFNAMLTAPALGTALQQVGAAIRYQTTLTPRVREMAILAVAARWDSEFERYAHEPIGRAAGLTDTEIDRLRHGDLPELTEPAERAAMAFVRAAVTDEDVDDATYDSAVAAIGVRTVFELTTLVGYYATLALQLRIFRVAAPPAQG
jgi:4-carboxymuconolactone decarboxylase